ncbi:MAG: ABC-F family ATP-binding cassette domain-containing protein [Bacteroidia bacterium]
MLSIEKIGIEFGGSFLFKEASYQFSPGKIFGLIGRNGAGKSSLLKVIAGKSLPSEGKVHLVKDAKIGYYHQDLLSYETEKSIFDVAKEAFSGLLARKDEIEHILAELEKGSEDWDLWDKLAVLQVEFEALGGDRMDASIYEILAGLGFKANEFHQPYKIFSGGWRMRVMLAKMLLEQPEILLLDEPTNHLDLPSIQWLENYLRTYSGVCVIVSHDRYFLDRMIDIILEISMQKLFEYPGNFSKFIETKAERMELQSKAYENQQRYIADQQRFINRFKAKASKATQAQSKLKQLNKLERVEAPEEENFDLDIEFKIKTPSGREVISLKNVQKSYGEKHVLKNSNIVIERGDKIALIGANGIGKSTLLRIIGGIEIHEGDRKEGHNLIQALFAQHQLEALNLKNTILQELYQMGSARLETELRTILGCFMFSGEDVDKKIQVLSGGEKSRVALAKVLISDANFLLLDEPTNHLDMPSIQILIQALAAYQGTFVVISHDRHFLAEVANKIWYIEDMQLKEYPGTYEEYDYWRTQREAEKLAQEKAEKAAKVAKNEAKQKAVVAVKEAVKPEDFEQQKLRKNRIKKLERQQEEVESLIEKLEKEKKSANQQLISPENAANYAKIAQIQQQISSLDKQIEKATEEWENVLLQLEELN